MASDENIVAKLAAALPDGALEQLQGIATGAIKNLTHGEEKPVLPPPAADARVDASVAHPAPTTTPIPGPVPTTVVPAPSPQSAELLVRLGDMLSQGLITRDEFDSAKAALLHKH